MWLLGPHEAENWDTGNELVIDGEAVVMEADSADGHRLTFRHDLRVDRQLLASGLACVRRAVVIK
jgi:hypothetical protein